MFPAWRFFFMNSADSDTREQSLNQPASLRIKKADGNKALPVNRMPSPETERRRAAQPLQALLRGFQRFWKIPLSALLFLEFLATGRGEQANPGTHPVPFRRVGSSEYQNFVKNWDDTRTPRLFALMDSAARFDAWFHPAPLNRKNKPMAPPPDLFKSEQTVLVARVVPGGGGDVDALFDVQRIEQTGKRLMMFYRFTEPGQKADFWIKARLWVQIPRVALDRVVFVENGREVGSLDVKAGEWSLPIPRDESGRALPSL